MPDKKLERKKKMEELTRADIIDSAMKILSEDGMKNLIMDRVAEGAGIAKGTLYLYFKNKKEIVDSVAEICSRQLDMAFEEIAESNRNATEKLREFIRVAVEYSINNKQLMIEMKNEMFSSMDQYLGDQESWYWAMTELIKNVLEDGIKSNTFREINTSKTATFFLDSIQGLMSQHVFSDDAGNVDKNVDELVNLYLNGISQ